MRGFDEHSGSLLSYVDLETRVPKEHPLRAIRAIANSALRSSEDATRLPYGCEIAATSDGAFELKSVLFHSGVHGSLSTGALHLDG